MTAGGTERWRRMRWSAPCGAVSKAFQASKEKMYVGFPCRICRCTMNVAGQFMAPCCQSLTTPYLVSTSAIHSVRGSVSSFMSS